jgi:hypothetical protein
MCVRVRLDWETPVLLGKIPSNPKSRPTELQKEFILLMATFWFRVFG